VIRSWGWSESEITITNIMTHAEAASNKDGWNAHENYGPQAWGGTGERWDLMRLTRSGADDGGDRLRDLIRSHFRGADAPPQSEHPLLRSTVRTMMVLDTPMDVLIDAAGVSWGRVSELLSRYGIPFIWDAQKRRILIGASDVTPRYSQNKLQSGKGLPTFELALQGGNSPVVLVGLIHQDQAYCQVLEFADEFGISASFNPFALSQRRGG
jgi:hypothetical protein